MSTSSSSEERVGMRVTSDPDETRIEQPETHGARERPNLPLRLVLASDLNPQASGGAEAPTSLVRVDRHDVADFMQRLAPRLTLDVPDALGDTPADRRVELSFPRLEAFEPGAVARQVPATRRLLALRMLVRRARDGEVDQDSFRAELAEAGLDDAPADELFQALDTSTDDTSTDDTSTDDISTEEKASAASEEPAADAPGREQPLDRLLRMVGDGQPASAEATKEPPTQAPEPGPLEALMHAVSEEGRTKAELRAADRLLHSLDARLSAQVRAVLHHPEVRCLEAAWRGLKFLADRLDFRAGIQLEVLPVDREALNEALYHRVLMPQHEDEANRPPPSAVILDFAFDRSADTLEQLHDLAEMGASLQAPLIGSAAAAFFGLERMGGLAKLPPLHQLLAGPEYIEWRKLREEHAARFLALALPPFLLHAPYSAQHRPETAFDYEADGDDGVWGGAALAVAAALAESFAEEGWPSHLEGRHLENLPLFAGPAVQTPLAALLPERRLRELAEAGFVALAGRPNQDAVQVAQASTVARPAAQEGPEAQAEARTHVSLPCQLFVARAAAALLDLRDELEKDERWAQDESLEAVQAEVERRLGAFLQAEDEHAVSTEPVEEADLPDHELLAVRLRPPDAALKQNISLMMGLQVPRRA